MFEFSLFLLLSAAGVIAGWQLYAYQDRREVRDARERIVLLEDENERIERIALDDQALESEVRDALAAVIGELVPPMAVRPGTSFVVRVAGRNDVVGRISLAALDRAHRLIEHPRRAS